MLRKDMILRKNLAFRVNLKFENPTMLKSTTTGSQTETDRLENDFRFACVWRQRGHQVAGSTSLALAFAMDIFGALLVALRSLAY